MKLERVSPSTVGAAVRQIGQSAQARGLLKIWAEPALVLS
jgi:hypothetical protein